MTPLMIVRWRATDYLEPYIGAGPSIVYSDWGASSDWDLGIDFRLGVHYRLGDLAGNPCWFFVEARGLYSQVDTGTAGMRGSMAQTESQSSSRPPKPPPEEPPPEEKPPPEEPLPMDVEGHQLADIDDWSVHLVVGIGVRW